MKKLLPIFSALACVLLCGCVSSPDFTPYVGKQGWPQSPGSFVETKYTVPIYYGWPDKPYIVLGIITAEGRNTANVARYAKLHGADALIYRKTLTGDAGIYTTPGHATSITSGNFSYGQYSGFTTTTYSPGISVPLVVSVTAYNAIKWEDPLQAKVDIVRNTLDWANAHPDGGNYVDGTDTNYFSAQQVQDLKSSLQEQLDDLQSPFNPTKAQAKVDELRSTLDWLNAHPDGGTYGEGPNAFSFSAGDIQAAKAANQQQLDDLLSRMNQFAKTNATGTLVSETAQFVPPPLESKGQTNASETFDYEKLKTFESDAESGDPLAQVLLAGIYGGGVGAVQKDSAKAAYWYLRAAKQGDDGSQFSVGEMYEKGEGVMQDFVEAYKWFNIAAIAPDIDWNTATNFFKSNSIDVQTLNKFKASWVPVADKAKAARDQLARQMTPDQIAEGQRRSAAFVPRKETPNSNSQSASPAAADSQ
jgi:TPR repeat protein